MADSEPQDFVTGLDIPEGEFAVYGTVYAYPEHADALEAVYTETTRMAQSEPGTIYYCICRDSTDRSIFHFFEQYASKKAFEDHATQPIMEKLMRDKLMKDVKAVFAKPIKPGKE